MSQHDFNIANQGFPAFRSDLNNALTALASNSSGDISPSTPYANQFWYETDNNRLYFRNEDNDAWITLALFDQTNDLWIPLTHKIRAIDTGIFAIEASDGTDAVRVDSSGNVTFPQNITVSGTSDFNGDLDIDADVDIVGNLSVSDPGSVVFDRDNAIDGPIVTLQKEGATVGRINSRFGLVSTLILDPRTNGVGLTGTSNGFIPTDENGTSVDEEIDLGSQASKFNRIFTSNMRVYDAFLVNAGFGSAATAYGVRAWVNFNGEGTAAIRESANVSSLTDNGTGDYTVNFTNSMPDANYAAVAAGANGDATVATEGNMRGIMSTFNYSTSSVDFSCVVASATALSLVDPEIASLSIVR